MVKNIIFVVLASFVGLMLFAPKKSLYYLLEKELEKSNIVISDEKISQNPVGLKIEDGKLYVDNTYIGNLESLSLLTTVAYNNIRVQEFKPNESIKKMMPISVTDANITYALWNPMEVTISIVGDVGRVKGGLNILEKKIHLRFLDSKRVAPIRQYLNKDESGWYYEQTL